MLHTRAILAGRFLAMSKPSHNPHIVEAAETKIAVVLLLKRHCGVLQMSDWCRLSDIWPHEMATATLPGQDDYCDSATRYFIWYAEDASDGIGESHCFLFSQALRNFVGHRFGRRDITARPDEWT